MGNKNKTISFRVNEDAFETLREIAEERDISLSAVFRDYVDTLVAHDGQVEVVPEHELDRLREGDETHESFPPTVEVPKSFIREHERLELEAEHLREQLEEHKGYVNYLREQLENDTGEVEEVIQLEDLDASGDEPPFKLG
ncbi:ribbon-helix-helix protein, CopG family [Haloferax larsenii]|uniref:Ribbon-helix-helix protein, CopG family n=1 Tax=Haloferax larsenii TaxID=302484 RepID=A0ABY5RJV3_HALLR|nr:ribbon-helix-helix protein, CopG family [Haloferax larsenii]ELZ75437.1 ribbon-helix-helix CopG family protein [Haloferax larsenii JCM 13917]UVE51455.1 ribbon-helix-helix protein, CopG family [Haloferax larsenii]